MWEFGSQPNRYIKKKKKNTEDLALFAIRMYFFDAKQKKAFRELVWLSDKSVPKWLGELNFSMIQTFGKTIHDTGGTLNARCKMTTTTTTIGYCCQDTELSQKENTKNDKIGDLCVCVRQPNYLSRWICFSFKCKTLILRLINHIKLVLALPRLK